MTRRIPCTVLTGFLGSGKTTLIQEMLRNPGGRRIALIVNEFGSADVDGDLVRSCGIDGCDDEDVLELANGCICCTVADDFLPTLTKLLERDTPPDHIVVETSGLALPQPLLRAFTWPEVKARVTVDGVITVIDARAVADGRFAIDEDAVRAQQAADESLDHESPLAELFEDQLSCADLVVVSKSDLTSDAELNRVTEIVDSGRRPAATVIRSGERKPPVDVLLGVAAAAETDAHARRSHHDHHHHADDDDHHHHHAHDHDHDDFDSFVVRIPPLTSPAALTDSIAKAGAMDGVLRIKGFARVEAKPMRLVIQAVGPRVDTYFDRPWRSDETGDGQLVVIGLSSFDRAAIAEQLGGRI